MPVVRLRPAFVTAVTERIAWLAEHRSEEQLDNFLAGLFWVRERVAQNAQAGPIVKEDEKNIVRMRLFPRPLPYLVYYGHAKEEPIEEVFLVQLYGAGQDRPEVDMSEWPW